MLHIIYGTRGRLDWSRLLQLVGEHWELLLWELVLFHYVYPCATRLSSRAQFGMTCLTRFRRSWSRHRRSAAFRGSLIDEKMFAIDVQEWGMENLLQQQRDHREPAYRSAGDAAHAGQ